MVIFINVLINLAHMAIISVSINNALIREVKKLKQDSGYSGTSEVIRAGLRMLVSEKRERAKLKGKTDAVLLIIHDDKYSEHITDMTHKYRSLVKTQVHNHLENHKCLQILVLNGDGQAISSAADSFRSSRKADLVKLIAS